MQTQMTAMQAQLAARGDPPPSEPPGANGNGTNPLYAGGEPACLPWVQKLACMHASCIHLSPLVCTQCPVLFLACGFTAAPPPACNPTLHPVLHLYFLPQRALLHGRARSMTRQLLRSSGMLRWHTSTTTPHGGSHQQVNGRRLACIVETLGCSNTLVSVSVTSTTHACPCFCSVLAPGCCFSLLLAAPRSPLP